MQKISDYKLKKKLGYGVAGQVFLAEKNDKQYAIKGISKAVLIEKNLEKEIAQELYINMILDHPNIVKCYSNFSDDKYIYIVLEYSKLGDLFNKIGSKGIPEKQAKNIIRDICKAFQYCHSQRICHRDLKPENILVFEEEKETVYKIADFGWATRQEDKKSGLAGTLIYLAPEMTSESANLKLCDKIDMWQLGILTYECLTGSPPFNANGISDLYRQLKKFFEYNEIDFTNVSEPAKKFILKLLVKEPEKRLSATEALNEEWLNS